MGSVSFVDQLVKGVILAAYDFVRLTLAGLLMPLISKRPRFWISVLSVQKRLSSLTYLALWIVLTVSIGLRSGAEVASRVAGLGTDSGRGITTTILLALFFCMLVDVTLRLCLYRLRFRVRRQLYGDLARIAAASIFSGASLIMVAMMSLPTGKSNWLAQAFPVFFLGTQYRWVPNPLIFAFCIPLFCIVSRAHRISGWRQRCLMVAIIVFVLPTILLQLSVPTYRLIEATLNTLSPVKVEQVEIYPAFPRCEVTSGEIQVSTDLLLKGADQYLIRSYYFGIYKVDDLAGSGEVFVGRPKDDQTGVVLLRDKYVHIELTVDPQPGRPLVNLPNGKFLCRLKLFVGWTGGNEGMDSLPQSVGVPTN